jgi:hypothetical protein
VNKNIGVKRIPVGRPSVIYQPRVEGIVPIMKKYDSEEQRKSAMDIPFIAALFWGPCIVHTG